MAAILRNSGAVAIVVASHDNYEKINSWLFFVSYMSMVLCPLGPGAPLFLQLNDVCFFSLLLYNDKHITGQRRKTFRISLGLV